MIMEEYMKKDYFKGYKLFKIIQLALLVIFTVTFFMLLYLDDNIRSTVYTNRNILTLCVFLWGFLIYSAVCLMLDFYQLQGHIAHDNNLNKNVYIDALTGIPNRVGVDRIFEEYSAKEDVRKIGCVLISISNLEKINHEKGRKAGNVILVNFSRMIERVGAHYGFVGRNNGNEFLAVIDNCTYTKMENFLNDISEEISSYNFSGDKENMEITCTYVLNEEEEAEDFAGLIERLYLKARR